MVADWSVECGADDPVLVVPWTATDSTGAAEKIVGGTHFIDLRHDPYALDQIPEAEQYPPLLQALRALNAARSPVFTAKCDAWTLDRDEVEALHERLDMGLYRTAEQEGGQNKLCGFGSYIDLIWRDRGIFASFHQSEQLLHRLARHTRMIEQQHALLDCILRPALVDLTSPHEGFAVSVYVKALGSDAEMVKIVWAESLAAVVALLRSKDLAFG